MTRHASEGAAGITVQAHRVDELESGGFLVERLLPLASVANQVRPLLVHSAPALGGLVDGVCLLRRP